MSKVRFVVLVEFCVKTLGGILVLKPGQIIKLPEQSARPLVETGKIKPLEEFVRAFDEVVNHINRNYKPGVIEYCRRRHPEAYNKMLTTENRLNTAWKEGTDPEEFGRALREWENIHVELLKLFKS